MHDPHCRIGKVTPKGNLRLFPGVRVPESSLKAQPQERVIALLRRVLAKAERGEIQSVAVAWIDDEPWPYKDFASGDGPAKPVSLMVGALEELKADILGASSTRTCDQGTS